MLLERQHMDASNVEAAAFTSIGKLGVSRRSCDRLYVNATRFSSDPTEFDRNFRRLVKIGKEYESRIGRSVFRGLVSDGVVAQVLNSDLKPNLEVAFPVGEFTGDRSSWLVYMANNKPGREQISPTKSMVIETKVNGREITPPLEKVKSVIDKGFTFTDTINEDQVDQTLSLWGETFGWNRPEVDNLKKRLEINKFKFPSQKDVWFSAAVKDGKIVSVAMAERLTIPGKDGRMLDLVESTEWRADNGHANNGLMTGTLDMLNAQVLSDLKDSPNGVPLIFAECNFQSHAEGVGQAAGLRIPNRTAEGYPAPQILIQNVLIRDGHEAGDSKQRDFTFLYLPIDVIRKYYNPMQVEQMKSLIES